MKMSFQKGCIIIATQTQTNFTCLLSILIKNIFFYFFVEFQQRKILEMHNFSLGILLHYPHMVHIHILTTKDLKCIFKMFKINLKNLEKIYNTLWVDNLSFLILNTVNHITILNNVSICCKNLDLCRNTK